MPIEYDIIENKQLVLVKGSGVISANDILSHFEDLSIDNRYTAPMKKLVDYRSIDSIKIIAEEANVIAQKKRELSTIFSEERCAFVSPSDLTFGTSRVHQTLIDGADINTMVFRRIEEALDWLDVTLEHEL